MVLFYPIEFVNNNYLKNKCQGENGLFKKGLFGVIARSNSDVAILL